SHAADGRSRRHRRRPGHTPSRGGGLVRRLQLSARQTAAITIFRSGQGFSVAEKKPSRRPLTYSHSRTYVFASTKYEHSSSRTVRWKDTGRPNLGGTCLFASRRQTDQAADDAVTEATGAGRALRIISFSASTMRKNTKPPTNSHGHTQSGIA